MKRRDKAPAAARHCRRHRWRYTARRDRLELACTRCGWGYVQPRLFELERLEVRT